MVKKLVKDSYLTALRILARLELAKHRNAKIIGITGSSGKTSCKEMVVALLKPHYKNTLKYTKKGNSETGIPYEILNIPVKHYKIWQYPIALLRGLATVLFNFKRYDVFVVEYGIDGPKPPINMDYLLGIVKPDISLLLSISSVHGENFEKTVSGVNLDTEQVKIAIAQEKAKLLFATKNKDFAFISKQASNYLETEQLAKSTILENLAKTTITRWENTQDGLTFSLSTSKGELTTTLPNLVLPATAQTNLIFGIEVLNILKKDIRTSIAKLSENYIVDPGRSSLLPGLNGTLILDSSYNANPLAALELFKIVKELSKKGRRKKIIILGDFRELGSNAKMQYEEVVSAAAKVADVLVLTNELMKEYGIPPAEEAGKVLNENLYWFENGRQLSFHINEVVEKNSIVLFEGSQNTVFLEYAVKELCSNKDPKYILAHIPRMSNDWLEIK